MSVGHDGTDAVSPAEAHGSISGRLIELTDSSDELTPLRSWLLLHDKSPAMAESVRAAFDRAGGFLPSEWVETLDGMGAQELQEFFAALQPPPSPQKPLKSHSRSRKSGQAANGRQLGSPVRSSSAASTPSPRRRKTSRQIRESADRLHRQSVDSQRSKQREQLLREQLLRKEEAELTFQPVLNHHRKRIRKKKQKDSIVDQAASGAVAPGPRAFTLHVQPNSFLLIEAPTVLQVEAQSLTELCAVTATWLGMTGEDADVFLCPGVDHFNAATPFRALSEIGREEVVSVFPRRCLAAASVGAREREPETGTETERQRDRGTEDGRGFDGDGDAQVGVEEEQSDRDQQKQSREQESKPTGTAAEPEPEASPARQATFTQPGPLGITWYNLGGVAVIRMVKVGSAAEAAGLIPNLSLEAINGESAEKMGYSAAVETIKSTRPLTLALTVAK